MRDAIILLSGIPFALAVRSAFRGHQKAPGILSAIGAAWYCVTYTTLF